MFHSNDDILADLPKVRGSYRQNADLSKINWFNVGGKADIMFRPHDVEDLSYFLQNKPKGLDITIIGVGSNLLVRDGGIGGIVIRLGRNFATITKESGYKVKVGAGALDYNVAMFACENNIAGMEFLIGIPGTIGGGLAMNAGAYSSDMSSILETAEAVDEDGNILELSANDMGFIYRGNTLPEGIIFTSALLQGKQGKQSEIKDRLDEISNKRQETQPVRSKTSGSTFKNPEGMSAWKLIDEAGCRGLKIGGAQVSEKHCNFFINLGNATATDIENLGEEVRERVFKKTGVSLEWEVKLIGRKP